MSTTRGREVGRGQAFADENVRRERHDLHRDAERPPGRATNWAARRRHGFAAFVVVTISIVKIVLRAGRMPLAVDLAPAGGSSAAFAARVVSYGMARAGRLARRPTTSAASRVSARSPSPPMTSVTSLTRSTAMSSACRTVSSRIVGWFVRTFSSTVGQRRARIADDTRAGDGASSERAMVAGRPSAMSTSPAR